MNPLERPFDPSWDAGQYLRFADQRLRPALELLARVPTTHPRLVVDLGCGTGNVTRLLAQRWRKARVVGVDSSEAMLEHARAEPSSIGWVQDDVSTWRPDESPDVVFSNAALHWVAEHDALLVRWLSLLAPDGCLAVQMPRSHDLASHRLMRTTLEDGGADGRPLGTPALRAGMARRPVADALHYRRLLAPHARRVELWETEHLQELTGRDPVLEWVNGTALRPILEALDDGERALFLDSYRRRLREAYPTEPDGRTLYPFRRLFVVADR